MLVVLKVLERVVGEVFVFCGLRLSWFYFVIRRWKDDF